MRPRAYINTYVARIGEQGPNFLPCVLGRAYASVLRLNQPRAEHLADFSHDTGGLTDCTPFQGAYNPATHRSLPSGWLHVFKLVRQRAGNGT